MAGETRKRRQRSTSKKQGTILDQLEQESSSALEVNKTPPTDYPCVTLSTDHERTPGRTVSALISATSSSSDDLGNDNGSKAKSKKRAIEHDEADTRVIEATSSATSSGLHLLSDTAERQSHATTDAVRLLDNQTTACGLWRKQAQCLMYLVKTMMATRKP
ncbi:hypothetical protein ACROYT_G029724 [Oculina patagonica]